MTPYTSILVVDNQPHVLEGLAQALSAEGYHVITANNGLEAITTLYTQPVDMIVADIVIPGINGYRLCQYIRSHTEWDALPFLFLTSFELDGEPYDDQAVRADAYLTKPIQPEDLLTTVRSILQQSYQTAAA